MVWSVTNGLNAQRPGVKKSFCCFFFRKSSACSLPYLTH
jgi:hypothetical protein